MSERSVIAESLEINQLNEDVGILNGIEWFRKQLLNIGNLLFYYFFLVAFILCLPDSFDEVSGFAGEGERYFFVSKQEVHQV
jgi:hypothetical protein